MDRKEYISVLEHWIQEIPPNTRNNILNYYNEYIQSGGEEKQKEMISELGSPIMLAGKLVRQYKDGLQEASNDAVSNQEKPQPSDDIIEEGEAVTNVPTSRVKAWLNGYDMEEWEAERKKKSKKNKKSSGKGNKTKEKNVNSPIQLIVKIILAIIILIIVLPFIGPLVGALVSLVSLFFQGIQAGFSLISGGVISISSGLKLIPELLIDGLASIGMGMMMLGAGMLIMVIFVKIILWIIPFIIKLVAKLTSLLFRKSRRG